MCSKLENRENRSMDMANQTNEAVLFSRKRIQKSQMHVHNRKFPFSVSFDSCSSRWKPKLIAITTEATSCNGRTESTLLSELIPWFHKWSSEKPSKESNKKRNSIVKHRIANATLSHSWAPVFKIFHCDSIWSCLQRNFKQWKEQTSLISKFRKKTVESSQWGQEMGYSHLVLASEFVEEANAVEILQ